MFSLIVNSSFAISEVKDRLIRMGTRWYQWQVVDILHMSGSKTVETKDLKSSVISSSTLKPNRVVLFKNWMQRIILL